MPATPLGLDAAVRARARGSRFGLGAVGSGCDTFNVAAWPHAKKDTVDATGDAVDLEVGPRAMEDGRSVGAARRASETATGASATAF